MRQFCERFFANTFRKLRGELAEQMRVNSQGAERDLVLALRHETNAAHYRAHADFLNKLNAGIAEQLAALPPTQEKS